MAHQYTAFSSLAALLEGAKKKRKYKQPKLIPAWEEPKTYIPLDQLPIAPIFGQCIIALDHKDKTAVPIDFETVRRTQARPIEPATVPRLPRRIERTHTDSRSPFRRPATPGPEGTLFCLYCGQWKDGINSFYAKNRSRCKDCILIAKRIAKQEQEAHTGQEDGDDYMY